MTNNAPHLTAELFAAGNYTTVAMAGSPERWETYAAMGLIGKTQAAIDGLSRFDHPEARFYSAVASWMDGDETTAARILEKISTPHAKNLLALIRKPKIHVLAQLPWTRKPPHDLLTAAARDGKFKIQNISFHSQDLPNEPDADIRTFYNSQKPPDFYICQMVEWHVIPPNLQQLPCPILGATADYDVHTQTVYPWLWAFDELMIAGQTEWQDVRRLAPVPVSTFPKLYGIADTLPPIPSGPREIDVFLSGTVIHPYHPDKGRLLHQILRMPDHIKILFIDGFIVPNAYNMILGHSKVSFTYVRHSDGTVTRGLEALSMGCAVVVQKDSVLTLYAGEEEGVLTYQSEADNLVFAIRRILDNWPEFEQRARRGAEIIRREFALSRVASQYLRFLTFLAAKPRSQRKMQPAEQLDQKRTVLCKGWLPGGLAVLRNMRERNLARWQARLETEASPRLVIDMARELVLEYAAAALAKNSPSADNQLLTQAFSLYRTGLARFPQSLALRFNLIRTALHFGQPTDVKEALQLAEETLGMPASSFKIDVMEDVFPYDFFSTFFNYRKYFDLITESLVEGTPVNPPLHPPRTRGGKEGG